jgi:hypothetical protein
MTYETLRQNKNIRFAKKIDEVKIFAEQVMAAGRQTFNPKDEQYYDLIDVISKKDVL